ncbi:MAG: hypothetical protein AB7U61_00935 [Methylocystis sp.]
MARLPIPEVTPVLTQEPRSGVSGAVFQQPQSVGIGDGARLLAEGIEEIAKGAAQKQGAADAQAALQRDPDGSVSVIDNQKDHFLFGPAGEAYAHSYRVGTLAAMQSEIDQRAVELRNQFRDDPQGFRAAMGKFSESIRAKFTGQLGQAAFNHSIQVGRQHYINAIEDRRQKDSKTFYNDTVTRIDDLKAEIGNIARGTVADNTDFIMKSPQFAQLRAYYLSLGDNPDYNSVWTPAKVDSELRAAHQEATNAWVYGNVQRIRDAQGIDAATDWAKAKILDSNTNMPLEHRRAAYNNAVNLIQTTTQEQKAQLNASRGMTAEMGRRFAEGSPPSDGDVDRAINAARKAFDVDSVMRLEAMREVYNARRSSNTLAPADQERALIGPQPAPSSGYYNTLIKKESGGNKNARAKTSSATGLAQFTTPTWSQLARNYPELGLTPGGRTDPKEVARALPQFTADNQKVLANAGVPINDRNTYLAHFLGAGGAVKFVRAMSANPNASAADIMPEAARANRALFFDRNAAPRSLKDVYAIATNGFSGDMTAMTSARPAAIPFTTEQVARNPYLASLSLQMIGQDDRRAIEQARAAIPLIESAIKIGAAPDMATVAHVLQVADQHPELGDVATKLRATVAAAPIAMQIAGHPDGGAAYVEQAEQIAAENPSLASIALASELKDQTEGARKAFAADPHAYAARPGVGWIGKAPAPIVSAISDPLSVGAGDPVQGLHAAIVQRRDAAYKIGGRTGQDPATLIFTDSDVKSVSGLLQRADGAGASTILRGLEAGLKPEELQALAGQKDFSNAVAGLARSGDPGKVGAAYGFLDKQWRENPEAFKKEFGADMATKLAVWQDKIAFMSPDQATRELQRANDPSTARAMDALRDQADKETKDLTPGGAISKAFGSYIPFRTPGAPVSFDASASGAAMLADYRAAYRDLFAESGDKSLAESRAIERVQTKWGPSDVNGGRIMAYPPERHYPPDISGSRSYIQNQLTDAIGEVAARYQQQGVDPAKMRAAPRALVADALTQEDIASRAPPSYRVIVQDDNGRWLPLEARPGVPLRFRADAQSVIEGQTQDFLVRRRQSGIVQGAM